MTRPDPGTFVSGLAVVVLGVVLLLDRAGDLELDFASTAPIVLAVLGVVLVASALGARDDGGA